MTVLKNHINLSITSRRFFLPLLFLLLFSKSSCSKKSQYQNPYLQNLSFSYEINLNLPLYNSLKYANNSVLVDVDHVGIKGVIVFNTGSGYVAFEASDPNHSPSACSQMQPDQFTAKCSCENNEYNLHNGQIIRGTGNYGMKPYRISKSGNILRIYN